LSAPASTSSLLVKKSEQDVIKMQANIRPKTGQILAIILADWITRGHTKAILIQGSAVK